MAKGKRAKKTRVSGGTVAVIVLAVVVAAAVAGVLGLGAYVAGLDTVYPNISVAGVDIGGMSYDKAHSTLLNADLGVPAGVTAAAKLTDLVSVSVTSDEAGLTYSVTDAVDTAYAVGRGEGFFADMFSYLDCLRRPHEITASSQFNEAGVRAIIAGQAALADHPAEDAAWQRSGDEILVTKGRDGYTVDQEAVYDYIRRSLLAGVSAETDEFAEGVAAGIPGGEPDFDAIYAEIFKAPQDAYLDAESGAAVAPAKGVSFDVAAAKGLFASLDAGETMTVPLIYTDPEISGEDINAMLFRDKLAEMNTTLSGSSANRITNVTLAAQAVNGTVLNPGDEFSFNGIVGKRTEEKGYKQATGYAGGTTVPMVGGGICQVSSTIYYCTLLADLEITNRANHGLTVSYLPAGLDATVSWGSIDFKFKNNRTYPVRVDAWVKDKTLYVELWGTKVDDITIELESNILKTLEPKVEEQVDETLKPGQTKVINKGKTGCVSESYKLYYDGEGNLIKRVLITKDTYYAEKKIVAVGPEPSDPAGPTTPTGPETTDPETTNPKPTEPETTDPGPTVPEPTDPETTGPDPTEPETTDPETTGPEETDPDDPGFDDPDPDPTDEEDEEGEGTLGNG